MNMKHTFGAALLGCSLLIGGSVSAATVTQLIHFDDQQGNANSGYTTADRNFFFNPTNFQSSTNCADTTESQGNGKCVIEVSQGQITTMTRLSSNDGGFKIFSLDSFYFHLDGQGTGNEISATPNAGTGVTFKVGQAYTNIFDYATGSLVSGILQKGVGYIADLRAITDFDNVTSVRFGAANTAQVRLDCIVATFDGTTTEPLSGFTNKCGLPDDNGGGGGGVGGEIPLPAGLPLMLGAFGVMAFVARRKARKA